MRFLYIKPSFYYIKLSISYINQENFNDYYQEYCSTMTDWMIKYHVKINHTLATEKKINTISDQSQKKENSNTRYML